MGQITPPRNTRAPDVSHFLPALTSSFLWDQRDIPSSESAECRLHFPQVGELGTHLCRPGAHTEIPDFPWAPLLRPEGQNGALWWAQIPFSSLLSRACVGAPMTQQGVSLLPLGPSQSSFIRALSCFLISRKKRYPTAVSECRVRLCEASDVVLWRLCTSRVLFAHYWSQGLGTLPKLPCLVQCPSWQIPWTAWETALLQYQESLLYSSGECHLKGFTCLPQG